jgi:hypothetical protein
MKTLTKLFMTLMVITLVMFSAQAQAKRTKRVHNKELKKINRTYKMSPNYQNTSAILRNGGNEYDHRTNRSKVGNLEVRKTYTNGRKIKTVKDSTSNGGDKVVPFPFGVPIPYPTTIRNLKEDEKFKDINFRSKNVLSSKD